MILAMCYGAVGSLLVCVLRARMCSGVHIIPLSLPPTPLTPNNGTLTETTASNTPQQTMAIWYWRTWAVAHSRFSFGSSCETHKEASS